MIIVLTLCFTCFVTFFLRFCRTLTETTLTPSPPPTKPELPPLLPPSTKHWSFEDDIRSRASSTPKPPEGETETNQLTLSTSPPKLPETTIIKKTTTPYPSPPSTTSPTNTPPRLLTEPKTNPAIISTSPKLPETTIIQSTSQHPPTSSMTPTSTSGPPPKISGDTITNPVILSTSPNLPETTIFQTTTPNPPTPSLTPITTPGLPPKVFDEIFKDSTSSKLFVTTIIKTTTSYPSTSHMTSKSTLSNILMTSYRSRTPQSPEHIPLFTEPTGTTHNLEYTTPIKDEPQSTKFIHATDRLPLFTNTNKNSMVTDEYYNTDGTTTVDAPNRGTIMTKANNNKTIEDATYPSAPPPTSSHTLPTTTKPKLKNETLLSTTLKKYETSQTNSNSAIITIPTTSVYSQTTKLVLPSRKTKSINNVSTPSKYVATTDFNTNPTTKSHHNEFTTKNIKATQSEEAQTTIINMESTHTSHNSMNNEPLPTQPVTRQRMPSSTANRTFSTSTETTTRIYYTETKTTEMFIQPTFPNTPKSTVNRHESSTVSGTSVQSNTPKLETFSKTSIRPKPTPTTMILQTKPQSSTTVSLKKTMSSNILPTIEEQTIARQTNKTSTQQTASPIVYSTHNDTVTLTHASSTTSETISSQSTSVQTNGEPHQQTTSRSSLTEFKASVTTPSVRLETKVFTHPPVNSDTDVFTSPSMRDMFTPPIDGSFSTPFLPGPNEPDLYDPLVRQAVFEMYCQGSTSTQYIPPPTKDDFINSVPPFHSRTISRNILLIWILWYSV